MVERGELLLRHIEETSFTAFFWYYLGYFIKVLEIQINGVMQRRRHLPDNPLHLNPEIPGQGRQEPMQVLPAQPEPNRHQDFPDLLLVIETILGMEETFVRPLPLLQHPGEDNCRGGVVREGKSEV